MCRGRGGREGEGQKRVRRELREKGTREGKRRACEKGEEEKHGIDKGKYKEGGRESEDGSGGEEKKGKCEEKFERQPGESGRENKHVKRHRQTDKQTDR